MNPRPRAAGEGSQAAPRETQNAPHVSEADKPLRRVVALAYHSARQVGKSHRDAYEEAMAVYAATRPGEAPLAASGRVAAMIAINVDPA